MRVLIVGATRPVLLDHVPVGCVDIFGTRQRVVWIGAAQLTFALRLLIVVKLEVCDQVMNRVDLLPIELNRHRVEFFWHALHLRRL